MAMDLFDKLEIKCKLFDSESILAMGIESA